MAVVRSWDGAGLADGVAFTGQAGSGDGAMFVPGGSQITVRASGSTPPRLEFEQQPGQVCNAQWFDLGDLPQAGGRAGVIELTAYPSAPVSLFRSNSATGWWAIHLQPTGVLRLAKDIGGTAGVAGVKPLPIGQQLRVEYAIDAAELVAYVFRVNSDLYLERIVLTTVLPPTDDIVVGPDSSATTMPTFWIDRILVNDDGSTPTADPMPEMEESMSQEYPVPVGEPKPRRATEDAREVPTVDPRSHLYGTQDGPLLDEEGRGVRNGVPYGEQLQQEADALNQQYWFRPAWVSRLRAATRSALGR